MKHITVIILNFNEVARYDDEAIQVDGDTGQALGVRKLAQTHEITIGLALNGRRDQASHPILRWSSHRRKRLC